MAANLGSQMPGIAAAALKRGSRAGRTSLLGAALLAGRLLVLLCRIVGTTQELACGRARAASGDRQRGVHPRTLRRHRELEAGRFSQVDAEHLDHRVGIDRVLAVTPEVAVRIAVLAFRLQ